MPNKLLDVADIMDGMSFNSEPSGAKIEAGNSSKKSSFEELREQRRERIRDQKIKKQNREKEKIEKAVR